MFEKPWVFKKPWVLKKPWGRCAAGGLATPPMIAINGLQ
jgi:hypothetical protein